MPKTALDLSEITRAHGNMDGADHEFGGVSTDLKLSLVESYLAAFTIALRPHFKQLLYIDAFAGTGSRTKRHEASEGDLMRPPAKERVEHSRGSARIAMDVEPHFDEIIFVDKNARHCAALRALSAERPDRTIRVLEGEANETIPRLLASRSRNGTRAVMFLDPYGMSVDWDTLKAIRESEAIDVWYLVSLSGIFRQAARKESALDQHKRAKLTRMLGTDRWEQAWYSSDAAPDLFGAVDETKSRVADVPAMERFVHQRLGELFPKVLKPLRLHNDRGVPSFALFFAISNPDRKAIGLAQKIANHILNSGRASQVRPR